MNIEVIKLVTSSLVKKISNLITNPTERGLILEPISTLFRLSVLSFKPKGTKVSITENKIIINGVRIPGINLIHINHKIDKTLFLTKCTTLFVKLADNPIRQIAINA